MRAETFSLVVNTVASEDRLQAWLGEARPGDRAIYASGLSLLSDAPGLKLIERWEQQGLVHRSGMGRDPDTPRRFNWFVTKGRAAVSGAGPAAMLPDGHGPCCTAAGRAGALDPVLITLHELLDHLPVGRDGWSECPSNNSLADALDVPRTTARRWMDRLRDAGLIEIEQSHHAGPRRVRIVAR